MASGVDPVTVLDRATERGETLLEPPPAFWAVDFNEPNAFDHWRPKAGGLPYPRHP